MPLVEMFEYHSIPYALNSSVARSLYGMQRAAFQIDILVDGDSHLLATFADQREATYLLCQDAAPASMPCQISFTFMHLPSLLPVVVAFPRSSSEQEMLDRAQSLVLIAGSHPVRVIAPVDAVLLALREYRESGETSDDIWLDLLGVLKVQGNALALPLLASQAETLQVRDLLQQAFSDAGLREPPSKEDE